jgi:hypothetical protein
MLALFKPNSYPRRVTAYECGLLEAMRRREARLEALAVGERLSTAPQVLVNPAIHR